MLNINENDTRDVRATTDPDELAKLRDIVIRIIEYGIAGANITDEIGHLLEALSFADHNSVCFVANFITSGREGEAEDDLHEGGSTLLPTWDTALERLIPWLESRGYEKRDHRWHSNAGSN
jgi:hypothetical protein